MLCRVWPASLPIFFLPFLLSLFYPLNPYSSWSTNPPQRPYTQNMAGRFSACMSPIQYSQRETHYIFFLKANYHLSHHPVNFNVGLVTVHHYFICISMYVYIARLYQQNLISLMSRNRLAICLYPQ